jgi:cytochrome c556
VRGNSAEARDLAARFAAFADDGQRLLGKIGQPSAVAAKFKRMTDDCQSCHAIYN